MGRHLRAAPADVLVAPAGFLAVQRGYESEADMLGLQYLYKTGYDPLGMVDIFEKIFSFDERKHGKTPGPVCRRTTRPPATAW